ncbi:unnamed protein product [Paramecium sonneborni]|uniref:Uncharacterized protein n=1 Tax=Paramecium sonneborni TaxID=65129 RepID=A0A8S1KYC6_9CILI|nr:unnamed protein product [Paramecium sonneborni]
MIIRDSNPKKQNEKANAILKQSEIKLKSQKKKQLNQE